MSAPREVVFTKISRYPFSGIVTADSPLAHALKGNKFHENLFLENSRPIKSGISTKTAFIDLKQPDSDSAVTTIFAKKIHSKNIFHSIKALLGIHRVHILWKISWYLIQRGVMIPKPYGYLLEWKGPFCTGGYYYSEAMENATDLGTLARDKEALFNRMCNEDLFENLAAGIGDFHNSGVLHGDLKWSNILIPEKGAKPLFVDLDAARITKRTDMIKKIIPDLSRFVLNALEAGTDQKTIQRFLLSYASYRNLPYEKMAQPIDQHLKKRIKKHEAKKHDPV